MKHRVSSSLEISLSVHSRIRRTAMEFSSLHRDEKVFSMGSGWVNHGVPQCLFHHSPLTPLVGDGRAATQYLRHYRRQFL